jgi:hypothetical protein
MNSYIQRGLFLRRTPESVYRSTTTTKENTTMPTIPNFPDSLTDKHHAWHQPEAHPDLPRTNHRGDKTMKRTTLRNMKCGIIMTVVILMISVVPVIAQSVTAQSEAPERSLEGVWLVKITPRNCTTGDPNPTAAFESLFTFHKDGTMLVSLRNGSLALERTAAHGLWRRDLGWSDYSFKFVHIRRNVTTGLFAGNQESGGTLVLSESGDEFTTDAHTQAYNADGTPAGPGGCSNAVGTRFKLEP